MDLKYLNKVKKNTINLYANGKRLNTNEASKSFIYKVINILYKYLLPKY